ncbi:hypothetical protein ZOSMA_29G01220 [Zostera marina]|uniref:Gamma-glutamylcyclotransferase family protein n=1 Tax=Zostera marina TaxID=29655 RepID=A0A0K9PE15_ZOSMR|nr:hypothetical protein ZOSMA_29G01220 [Zostera marina]
MTSSPYPLVCGPYRVLFHKGKRVSGKFYAVTSFGLAKIDELEDVFKGHYERFPLCRRRGEH